MLFNKAVLIDIISTPDKNNQIYTIKIIETIAIVSIVISEKIDKISFMKTDLEGTEVLVLNGAIETLKQMRIDTMITEFHSHGDYIILSNYEEDFLYGPLVLLRAFSSELTRFSNLFSILLLLYSLSSIFAIALPFSITSPVLVFPIL